MLENDDFIRVIKYYLPHLILILIIKFVDIELDGSLQIILGVAITFIGFGVQARGKGLHKHFNHNDIFHVIQMIAIFVIFTGVRQLIDIS